MRDTTSIPRPYFREGTEALASLVATRPARDVLLSVAAELSHRERPAARRLAATVAELLSGVSAIGQASEPVAIAPVVAAPVVAKAPRQPSEVTIGTTPRQRTAFRALSDELRAHLRAWDAWHAAWRQHVYLGGPNPGPEPIDTTSPEARARAERAARYDAAAAERAAQDAAHHQYWGGDLAARDRAIRTAPKGDMGDAKHVAKVKAHMAEASKAARDAAKAAAEHKAKADAAHAEWNAARLHGVKPDAPRKAAAMARTTFAPSASASNRARAF